MTTIRISHETKKVLDTFRHHPKESYEDIIRRLVAARGSPVYDHRARPGTPAGVYETTAECAGAKSIEEILSDIAVRLDRIEEKVDENIYPPESALRPEFVQKIKKAHADIRKGKGKTYSSIDDFFRELEA